MNNSLNVPLVTYSKAILQLVCRYVRPVRFAIFAMFGLMLAAVYRNAGASEYVSLIFVRYSDSTLKTFVQGPDKSKALCEKLSQVTWDNIVTVCGKCSLEKSICLRTYEIEEMYADVLQSNEAIHPYVIATPKSRIIISGIVQSAAIAECQRLAQNFRSNGYRDARCLVP